jgi:hypothetical protein
MSDALEDVVDIAVRVAEALEKVGASYFVGGSLASSIDGEPRRRRGFGPPVARHPRRLARAAGLPGPGLLVRLACLPGVGRSSRQCILGLPGARIGIAANALILAYALGLTLRWLPALQ